MKIIMDDYGLETYASSLDALDAFAANIRESDVKNSAILGWEYTSEDLDIDDVWSFEPSMEGIKDRVKEMASKAKSNIVAWAQKLIDLIFGTFNRLIRRQKANSTVLKKTYNDAITYIKSLKELESVAKNSTGTIKISDWGRANLQVMVLMLSISYSLTHTVKEMNEFVGNIFTKSTNQTDNKTLMFSLNLKVILELIRKVVLMCGLVMSVDVFKGSFYDDFKNMGYDFNKVIANASGLKFVNANVDMSKVVNAIKTVLEDITNPDPKNDNVFNDFARIKGIYEDADIKNVRAAALQYMTQNIEAISKPRTAELEYKTAYDYLLENLELFVSVSENNAELWKFDKHIKETENLRRKMNQVIQLIRDDHEEYMKFLLNVILETGGLFTAIVTNVEKAAKLHDDITHNFMDDAVKLGRDLKKIEAERQSDINKKTKKNYSEKEEDLIK